MLQPHLSSKVNAHLSCLRQRHLPARSSVGVVILCVLGLALAATLAFTPQSPASAAARAVPLDTPTLLVNNSAITDWTIGADCSIGTASARTDEIVSFIRERVH